MVLLSTDILAFSVLVRRGARNMPGSAYKGELGVGGLGQAMLRMVSRCLATSLVISVLLLMTVLWVAPMMTVLLPR